MVSTYRTPAQQAPEALGLDGRQTDWQLFTKTLEGHQPKSLLLLGGAGMGKSRLLTAWQQSTLPQGPFALQPQHSLSVNMDEVLKQNQSLTQAITEGLAAWREAVFAHLLSQLEAPTMAPPWPLEKVELLLGSVYGKASATERRNSLYLQLQQHAKSQLSWLQKLNTPLHSLLEAWVTVLDNPWMNVVYAFKREGLATLQQELSKLAELPQSVERSELEAKALSTALLALAEAFRDTLGSAPTEAFASLGHASTLQGPLPPPSFTVVIDHWDAITPLPAAQKALWRTSLQHLLRAVQDKRQCPLHWVLATRPEDLAHQLSPALYNTFKQKMLLGPLPLPALWAIAQQHAWVPQLPQHTALQASVSLYPSAQAATEHPLVALSQGEPHRLHWLLTQLGHSITTAEAKATFAFTPAQLEALGFKAEACPFAQSLNHLLLQALQEGPHCHDAVRLCLHHLPYAPFTVPQWVESFQRQVGANHPAAQPKVLHQALRLLFLNGLLQPVAAPSATDPAADPQPTTPHYQVLCRATLQQLRQQPLAPVALPVPTTPNGENDPNPLYDPLAAQGLPSASALKDTLAHSFEQGQLGLGKLPFFVQLMEALPPSVLSTLTHHLGALLEEGLNHNNPLRRVDALLGLIHLNPNATPLYLGTVFSSEAFETSPVLRQYALQTLNQQLEHEHQEAATYWPWAQRQPMVESLIQRLHRQVIEVSEASQSDALQDQEETTAYLSTLGRLVAPYKEHHSLRAMLLFLQTLLPLCLQPKPPAHLEALRHQRALAQCLQALPAAVERFKPQGLCQAEWQTLAPLVQQVAQKAFTQATEHATLWLSVLQALPLSLAEHMELALQSLEQSQGQEPLQALWPHLNTLLQQQAASLTGIPHKGEALNRILTGLHQGLSHLLAWAEAKAKPILDIKAPWPNTQQSLPAEAQRALSLHLLLQRSAPHWPTALRQPMVGFNQALLEDERCLHVPELLWALLNPSLATTMAPSAAVQQTWLQQLRQRGYLPMHAVLLRLLDPALAPVPQAPHRVGEGLALAATLEATAPRQRVHPSEVLPRQLGSVTTSAAPEDTEPSSPFTFAAQRKVPPFVVNETEASAEAVAEGAH